jgi:peptidoglycan/LPS O-acetylase OafA/YrhL
MGLFDIHPEQSVLPVLRCLSGFGLGMIIYRLAVFARTHGFHTPPAWCYGVTGALLLSQMAPGFDLISLALTPLFIFTLLDDNAVAKALGSGPLVFLGEISYAVYLIHGKVVPTLYGVILAWWPGATNTLGRVGVFYAGFILATIIIATVANRFVEVPARRWLRRSRPCRPARPRACPILRGVTIQVLRPGPASINHRE